MDALLPLWIIGSVLILAIVDRISTKTGTTAYRTARDSFGNATGHPAAA